MTKSDRKVLRRLGQGLAIAAVAWAAGFAAGVGHTRRDYDNALWASVRDLFSPPPR